MLTECPRPILFSADIGRSLTYYTEVLGFTSKWDWGEPPTFGGACYGHFEILFCKDGQGHPGTWFYLFVDNVDVYYETIKAKGATIINPPQNMDWHIREILVEDPDGHRIRFGQRL